METNINMEIWNSVKTTDPKAVKPISGKSYKGNSPQPYWLIKRATEEFGPIGIGWGMTVKSQHFERISESDVLHVAVVSVWYKKGDVVSQTFDHIGGTKASYMSKNGALIVDEDAAKKSVTDGLVKCLSMLGFAGDIFSGQWDDSKYVEWAKGQFEEKMPDDIYEIFAEKIANIESDFEMKDLLWKIKEVANRYPNDEKLAKLRIAFSEKKKIIETLPKE